MPYYTSCWNPLQKYCFGFAHIVKWRSSFSFRGNISANVGLWINTRHTGWVTFLEKGLQCVCHCWSRSNHKSLLSVLRWRVMPPGSIGSEYGSCCTIGSIFISIRVQTMRPPAGMREHREKEEVEERGRNVGGRLGKQKRLQMPVNCICYDQNKNIMDVLHYMRCIIK